MGEVGSEFSSDFRDGEVQRSRAETSLSDMAAPVQVSIPRHSAPI